MKRIIIPILIGLFLGLHPACRQKENTGEEDYSGPVTGDLEITFVSPKGRTGSPDDSGSLVIMFSHPMIPLEAIDERKDPDFIHISPRVKGDFHWLNPKTLTFIPRKRLPYATEFQVTVAEGTQSFQGRCLDRDYIWTFQTITPDLIRHDPSDNQKWTPLDSKIWLIFNMPVSPEQARSCISLLPAGETGKEFSLPFSLKHPTEKQRQEHHIEEFEPDQVLLMDPHELAPAQTYSVEIHSGLPSREGHLGMLQSRSFSFTTYMPFEFSELITGRPHNPDDSIRLHFSNPVSYSGLIENLKISPPVDIPEYYLSWNQAEPLLYMSLPFEPETEYTLSIQPGLQDIFGNQLKQKVTRKFKTSSYPPSLEINTGNGLLEAYGDRIYPIHSINISQVLIQAARISADKVIPLLTKKDIFWSRNPYNPGNFYEFEKNVSLNRKQNIRTSTPFETDLLLQGDPGWIFLQIDTRSEEEWNRFPKALLQVTGLGITAKYSPSKNLIWVTTLQDGQPVPDAHVEIRDDANQIRWDGRTDKNGKTETPGWSELGIKRPGRWNSPRQWVMVYKDGDSAFTNSEWYSGISPYEFGINYDWSPPAADIQGYIYSDRGIYQAGERVHLKGIIRENTGLGLVIPDYNNAELEIWDPLNQKVLEQTVSFNRYGTFSLDYSSPAGAALGTYRVVAELPETENDVDSGKRFSGNFRMETFRPAQYELHLKTGQESYVFGDRYHAAVQANYLSGGAMSGQDLEWHLRLSSSRFSPQGHEGYVFGNRLNWWEDWDRDDSRLLSSGEKKLDDQGRMEIHLDLKPEKEMDSVTATLESTVKGPDRRQVTSRIQTLIHRGRYYIGLKPSSLFIPQEQDLKLEVIASSPEGRLVPGKDIHVQLISREWHSVRKSTIGGRFRWVSEKKDTLIDTKKVKSGSKPQTIIFQPDKSGFYILKAEGRDKNGNTVTTASSVYITGKDYIPWKRDNDDAVEIVPDRSHYQPGDTAELLIKSPYEKSLALITAERESILESRLIEIESSMHKFRLPVTAEHIPNVFVSVILIQGRTDPAQGKNQNRSDLGKPSFKLGYCQLNVDPAEKRLHIKAETGRKTYQPGDKVKLNFKVSSLDGAGKPAEVSVAVVDVGVLNLIGFQTPDPFSLFYRHRPLSVHTTETRHQVISRMFFGEKGENSPGAAGEAGAPGYASLSEILLRRDFRPLAYWNPAYQTGEDGQGEVEFDLPDNLTKFRVMLVALTEDSCFGRGMTDFQVTKPLLLRPSIPRFSRLEDAFKAGVVIQNNSPSPGDVILQAGAQGISMSRPGQKHDLYLQPGESREILFDFKADQPGRARFTFKAAMGSYSDGLEAEIPIQQPRQTETAAVFNQTETSAAEIIQLPENVYPQYSRLDFYASPSALSGIKGGLRFLREYPYLCLEQQISSILPFLVAGDIIRDFSLSPHSPEHNRRHIEETLSLMKSYQQNDGGFSLWPGSHLSSPFLSSYAAFCLMQAEKSGFPVPESGLSKVLDYLSRVARGEERFQNHPYSRQTSLSVRAFALYLLAAAGRPEPGYTEKLFAERKDLSTFGKTMLLKAMHHEQDYPEAKKLLLQELMNKIKVSPTHAYFENDEGARGAWIFSSGIRTTALVLQTLLEMDTQHDFFPAMVRWLVSRREAGRWPNTQDNFFVFYALNQYYQRYEDTAPDFVLDVGLEEKNLLRKKMKAATDTVREEMPLPSWPAGTRKKLRIDKSGKGTLYYETRMHYVPHQPAGPRDEGFSLQKQFLSLDGTPLTDLKTGQLIIVSLRIITPQERLFVVVEDPVPAGIEAVHPDFKIESQEMQRKLRQWILQIDEGRPHWRGFSHTEIHNDRVRLFADSLAPGIHYHHYLARVLLPGEYRLPGAKAEEMYTPEVFGRSEEKIIIIKK